MQENKLRIYQNATAIVTGGASGIGKAIAEELVRRGAEVVLADLQQPEVQGVAAKIVAGGGRATAVILDVADRTAMIKLVTETFVRTGRLDFMFNNAGVNVAGGVHQLSPDDWDYINNINIRGVVNGVQAAYPLMLRQGFGHIVNMGSIAGLIAAPGIVAYSMTKHAVVGLSRSLRAEAGLSGIRVSVLCPGIIRTPMSESGGRYGRSYAQVNPDMRKHIAKKVRAMPSDLFARRALDAVARNKAIIVEPASWRWRWRFNRLCPDFAITIAQKILKKKLVVLGIWSGGQEKPLWQRP